MLCQLLLTVSSLARINRFGVMTFQDKQYLVQQPFVLIIIDILHKVGQFTVKLSYASIQ